MAGDPESVLCTSCGLCCTGAIHDYARLDPSEVEGARALGLPLIETGTEPSTGFLMPCPRLAGSLCTIYADRPQVCRRFACQLLLELRQGTKSLDEGLALTARVRALVQAATASLRPGETLPSARRQMPGHPGVDAPAPQQLAMLAMTHFIDRHFRKPSEGSLLTMDSVAAPTENLDR